MEDLDTPQIDAEADGFSLIDVSASDDDFLLASSSDVSIVDNPGFAEEVPKNQPFDSLPLHRPRKTGKCNLRKSLAWDSAFFTNAGVLDPEELSSIIEGAELSVKQNCFLPGIQEELSKSTDSISTFQSDLTLESLEADLFCDIRASIQKCSKSSTIGDSSGSKIHGKEEFINGSSTKLVEPSRKMAKPKSASSKLESGVQGSVRTLKPGSVCKHEKKPPVNRSREPSSLLSRPLKAAGVPSLQAVATTKRMSVGASHVKLDVNGVGNVKGKVASLPEASRQVNSRKPLPKAPVLSKIPAASSVLNRTTTRSSRSSCDSSSSSASEPVQKSQTGGIRRKMDKNVNLPSGSKTRTSSKVVEKVKSQKKESRLFAYVKSTSNLSPSISPASSISEWSTESSSSTATVNQKQFGFNSCPPSLQDVAVDSSVSQNMHKLSSDRALGGHNIQVPGSVAPNTRPGFAKPSGLRMPSPNIGFFDGVKAGARTPSSSSRSRSASSGSLPRSVAGAFSPSGTTIKTKLVTSAAKMTSAAAGTAKFKQRNPDASLKTPASLLEMSVDLLNPSIAKHIDNDSQTSSKLQRNIPPKSALERNEKVLEPSDVEKHVPDSQLVDEDKLTSDLVTVDSVETCSEFLTSISPKSALERNNENLEASDPGNHVLDSQLVDEVNFICDLVTDSTEDGPNLDPQSFDANLKSFACTQESVGLQNPASASSELPESTLSKSALEKDSDIATVTDGGKQVLGFESVAKGNLVTSEEGASLERIDLGSVTVKDQLKSDPESSDLNLMPTDLLQGASRAKDADNDSGTLCELSESSLQKSSLERTSEVADGKYSLPGFVTAVKEDSTAAETEGILHLANDLVTVACEDGSNIEQIYSNNSSNDYTLSSPQQVNEADNLKVVSQQTQQDKVQSVEHSASDVNTTFKNGLVEIKENAYAENQGEGFDRNVEPRDHKVEMQEESYRNMQSESEQFASLISHSSPLPCAAVDPAARTPFAVKNSESNFVEVSNSPTGSAAESFLKVPFLEKSQQENS